MCAYVRVLCAWGVCIVCAYVVCVVSNIPRDLYTDSSATNRPYHSGGIICDAFVMSPVAGTRATVSRPAF